MDHDSGNNAVYSEVGAADVMKGFTIDANSCYGQVARSAQSASNNKKHACSKIALVILYIIVIALLLALVGACIAFTIEISNIKSETTSFQTASSLQGSQNALVSRIEDLMQQGLELKTAVVTTAIQSNESYSAYLQLNHTIQQLRVQLSQGFSAIDGNIQLLNVSIESINSSLGELKTAVVTTAVQSNESYSANLQLNHTIQQLKVQLSQGFSAIDGNVQLLNVSIERINSTAIQSSESYLQLNHTIQQLRVQFSQGFSTIDGNIQLLNVSIERINSTAIQSNESYLQLNHTVQQLRVRFSAIDGNVQLLNVSIERINSTAIQSNESYLQLNHTVQQLRVQLSQGFSAIDGNIQLLNVSIERINSSLGSGRHANVPAPSCAALPPSSPSGYYWVRASNGSPVRVYCDITRSCGGVTGGWMRVAELDMTISSQECPSSLRERTDFNRRLCEIIGMCATVNFDLQSLQYSRVCGKIQAYQVGSTDAFQVGVASPTIEQHYVDGISLTHGHPRQHIWTFAAALNEVGTHPLGNCPCTNTNQAGSAGQPPAFVGSDYFCDTASTDETTFRFYGDDPLWDGAGCGPLNTCCSFNSPPWFFKQLLQPTTNDIEMRVCRDELVNNENIPIEIIEIYVQ